MTACRLHSSSRWLCRILTLCRLTEIRARVTRSIRLVVAWEREESGARRLLLLLLCGLRVGVVTFPFICCLQCIQRVQLALASCRA